jgi:hypothetical protein
MGLVVDSYRFAAAGPSFDPTDIAGLVGWWDASDSSTITESSGIVSLWEDKAGGGYDFIETVGTVGPTTGTVTINGLNALDFNGSTQTMALSGPVGNLAPQPVTVLLVAKLDANTSNRHITDQGDDGVRFLITGDGNWRAFAGSAVIGNTVSADTDPHTITFVGNGASSSMRVDGSSVGSGNPGSGGVRRGWRIFLSAGAYTDGRLGEMLVYDSALSGTDLTDAEDYLMDKWGI